FVFFFSSRRRHTRSYGDWSSDVCSSDLHPPFPTGLQHMDSINCRNAPAMAEILRGRTNIERVACGHHHRSIQIRWAGTIGSVAPSVAHQVVLDLKPHDDATFTMEPPGYHMHLWQPDA